MKKWMVYALVATFAFALMGCAGMINGQTQAVTIDSNVKGATITILKKDGTPIELGTTPYTGPLSRMKDATIIIKKPGYSEKRQILETKLSLVFFLNFFIPFGTFSSSTDISNETLWEYSPGNLYVNLEPVSSYMDFQDFRKDTDIKRFVMMNYQQLANDLSQSHGKYLDALVLELMQVKPENYKEVAARLREELASNWSVVAFGEHVAQYYFDSKKS